MIDHISITVSDYNASCKWYEAVLKPVGYVKLMELKTDTNVYAGFGEDGSTEPYWWVSGATKDKPAHSPSIHVAFRVQTRNQVDEFYAAAIAAGGIDNGKPGLREENYYAAFVLDPDGHNIEAVCHSSK